MTAAFIRDATATATICGFFAAAWFGWAQDDPPPAWRRLLLVGSILSMLTAVAGGLLTWQHWSGGTVFNSKTATQFGAVVAIEFVLAGVGASLLAARGRQRIISAWVALVVGIHFFPVAMTLQYPLLYGVGAFVTVAALAAIPLAKALSIAVSAVTGLTIGIILLVAALISLATVVPHRPPPHPLDELPLLRISPE